MFLSSAQYKKVLKIIFQYGTNKSFNEQLKTW